MNRIFESDIEQFVIELLYARGYEYVSPERQESAENETGARD